MKLRRSICGLLLVVPLACVFIVYWRSRPSTIAEELEHAIKTGEFQAADQFFQHPRDKTFVRWGSWHESKGFGTTLKVFVDARPQTLSEYILGRRMVSVSAHFLGEGLQAVISGRITVTALGANKPQVNAIAVINGPKTGLIAFHDHISKEVLTITTDRALPLSAEELLDVIQSARRNANTRLK